MKIIDYKILSHTQTVGLELMVKQHIQDGWQPLGGVGADKYDVHQAMVKYED